MKRPLASWAPFAITALGLVMIPIMFAIPRDSEGVDTFLEAVPFFVVFLGVVSFVFARPGRARVPGTVFALVVLLAVVSYPLALPTLLTLGHDPPHVSVEFAILPEREGSYTVFIPSPVDGSGNVARVVAEARFPVWQEVTRVEGAWYLRVQADGPVERTFDLEGDKGDEKWPETVFAQQGSRFDSPTFPSIMQNGTGSLLVKMRIVGSEPYCDFDQSYHGAVSPDDEGFARLGDSDYVCT